MPMIKSILGIYFEELHDTDNFDAPPADVSAVMNAGATVIKIGPSFVKAVEAAYRWPQATIIYRNIGQLEEIMEGWKPENGKTPEEAVAHWIAAFKEVCPKFVNNHTARNLPNIRYCGAFNEWGDWPNLGWYDKFETLRIKALADLGCLTLTGFWSAEVRLWEPIPGDNKTKVQRLANSLITAADEGAWLDHHLYNGPTLRDKGHLPGTDIPLNDDQDFMFAYRAIRQECKRLNIPCPDIFCGELGEDVIIYPSVDSNHPAKPLKGWKAAGYSRANYTRDLFSVADEMWLDGVMGVVVFYDQRRWDDEYNISFGGKPKDNDPSVALRIAAEIAQRPYKPGPTGQPRPDLPPVPEEPKGERTVTILSFVNHRDLPTINSKYRGRTEAGETLVIIGNVSNGYVQEKYYGFWVLAANLKGV